MENFHDCLHTCGHENRLSSNLWPWKWVTIIENNFGSRSLETILGQDHWKQIACFQSLSSWNTQLFFFPFYLLNCLSTLSVFLSYVLHCLCTLPISFFFFFCIFYIVCVHYLFPSHLLQCLFALSIFFLSPSYFLHCLCTLSIYSLSSRKTLFRIFVSFHSVLKKQFFCPIW